MSLAVDKPIINNHFEEPKEYWVYVPQGNSNAVLWGQTPKLTFRKRAAYAAGSGKPH